MTREHVPVLAGELIEVVDPRSTAPSAAPVTRACSPTGLDPPAR
jgi:hypothetical protein